MYTTPTIPGRSERDGIHTDGQAQQLRKLIIHSDQLVVYPDGNKVQVVTLHFEVDVIDGVARLSNEVSDFGYFRVEEMEGLKFLGRHRNAFWIPMGNTGSQ